MLLTEREKGGCKSEVHFLPVIIIFILLVVLLIGFIVLAVVLAIKLSSLLSVSLLFCIVG